MNSIDSVLIARFALAALLCGCASTEIGLPPTVPDSLRVPASQSVSIVAQANGVQIYDCAAVKTEPARVEWVFRAPEVELFDGAGKKIGKHYAGPTWESNDGSKVVGEIKGRDDGPDASAIPWLLLNAKTTEGNGIFGKTLSIQRVNTVGGKAPAEGCSQLQVGKEARIAYRASYYFYVARP